MRSIKKTIPTEHGKQNFAFDDTPNVKCTFLGGPFHRRGFAKMKNLSVALHEKQRKKTILTEHGSQYFDFCNPSNVKQSIFPVTLPRIPRIPRIPQKRDTDRSSGPPYHTRRGPG